MGRGGGGGQSSLTSPFDRRGCISLTRIASSGGTQAKEEKAECEGGDGDGLVEDVQAKYTPLLAAHIEE